MICKWILSELEPKPLEVKPAVGTPPAPAEAKPKVGQLNSLAGGIKNASSWTNLANKVAGGSGVPSAAILPKSIAKNSYEQFCKVAKEKEERVSILTARTRST